MSRVLSVADLRNGTDSTITHDAIAIDGANPFTLYAFACRLTAGLAELGPVFIDVGVAIVIGAVAALRLGNLIDLQAHPVDVAQWFGAGDSAAAREGGRPGQRHRSDEG